MIKKMKITGFLFLIMAVFFSCSQEQPQKEAQEPLKSIHERAITLDTHVDIGRNYATEELDPGINNPRLKCDLTKMETGGMDGVFLAVFVGQGKLDAEGYKSAYDTAMTKFNAIHRLTEEMYSERCELATSPDDTERIVKTGKRAIMIGIENGYPVYMLLSWDAGE